MDEFVCFWCDQTFPVSQKTADHIIPRSCDGAGTPDNLRDACGACNRHRGLLPDYYKNGVRLVKRIRRWSRRHPDETDLPHHLKMTINRYNTRSYEMLALLLHWQTLELQKLGCSPSTKIPYIWSIPCRTMSNTLLPPVLYYCSSIR